MINWKIIHGLGLNSVPAYFQFSYWLSHVSRKTWWNFFLKAQAKVSENKIFFVLFMFCHFLLPSFTIAAAVVVKITKENGKEARNKKKKFIYIFITLHFFCFLISRCLNTQFHFHTFFFLLSRSTLKNKRSLNEILTMKIIIITWQFGDESVSIRVNGL